MNSAAAMTGWVIARDGRRLLVLWLVLMLLLGSVALGLAHVVEGVRAELLLAVAALGILTGWALAALRLRGWLAAFLSLLLGTLLLVLNVGGLAGKLAGLFWMLFTMPGRIWRGLLGGEPMDWASISSSVESLWFDLLALAARLGHWMLAFVGGNAPFDPVALALVWGLGVWLVAVWAGRRVYRGQPLRAAFPAILLLLVTSYYARADSFAMLPVLGALLLLMALIGQDARERRWRSADIDYPRHLWQELASRALTLSFVLVLVAAVAPSVSVRQIADAVERLREQWEGERDPLAEPLGLEGESGTGSGAGVDAGDVLEGLGFPGLPRSYLVGLGADVSRRAAMIVQTDGTRPNLPEPALRTYWRGATYDRYTGRGWATSKTEEVRYRASEPAGETSLPFHRPLRQRVQAIGNLGETLHVAGVLVTVDHAYRVAYRSPGDVFGALSEATTFEALSLLPIAGEAQLRAAGSDYPDWVQERYLLLPGTVPERVFALARGLAEGQPTPYDQALAIEAYLRTFPYTLDVPMPPFEQDLADYFLFDLREGYCDYYATAMVVLARAVGLPARLVTGYVSGTYDEENGSYLVVEADAHSWVEIYFPGIAWVEFEPTGGRAPIERPADIGPLDWTWEEVAPPEENPALGPAGGRATSAHWWPWLVGGSALVLLAGVFSQALDVWRLRFLKPVRAVETLYARLRRQGRRLVVPMQAGDTPHEFGRSLAGRMARLARGDRWPDRALRPAAEEVQRLVALYVQASYMPTPPGAPDQVQAVHTWQRLRWRLRLARILGRLWPRRT